MTRTLAWAALRRHPLSLAATAVLVVVFAAAADLSTPLALLLWATAGLASLKLWQLAEPLVLRRRAWREPSHLERERLDLVAESRSVQILVIDRPEPWLGSGLRCLLISRGLLDLLEDRALVGLLSRALADVPSAGLAGGLLVWLGNLPLFGAWCVWRCLGQLGRLLAVAVGACLVLPLVLWPAGFVRWIGGVFGAIMAVLLGASLLSGGMAAPGVALLVVWAIMPGLWWVLDAEVRRAERAGDDETSQAGLGWELLEAMETLIWAESAAPPDSLVARVCRPGAALEVRTERLWRALSQTE